MFSQAIKEYKEQINTYEVRLSEEKKNYRLWSLIRFLSFLLFASIIIVLFTKNIWLGIIAIYVSAYIFFKIIHKHIAISEAKERSESIIEINKAEIAFLTDLNPFRSTGKNYFDNNHPYSSDLDLFGDNSLFQYIERTATRFGKNKLAQRLSKAISKDEILLNQGAVAELEMKLDWRQRFIAGAPKESDEALDDQALARWTAVPSFLLGNRTVNILRFILPIISLAAFVVLCFYIPYYFALIAFIPSILFQRKYSAQIDELQFLSEHSLKYISSYKNLIETIENEKFDSLKLKELQSHFLKQERTSKKLKRLDWYLDQLDLKNIKIFGTLFNMLTLYDIHFTLLIEKWKKENKDDISKWTDSLAEFEFLQSLANLSFNNSTWNFPSIGGNSIKCIEIGHPLLTAEKRISNTIDLAVPKHIKLITGSNMAGKSTFQRTIGINMILAYCGSKVCATEMQLPILQLLSSMRTQDDLSKDASGFYAELQRLKMVLDEVQAKDNNYFLIDEILKGTNTVDRHKGSKALIKQLLQANGAGLISTHDLELAKLEETENGNLQNICFEVDVVDDKLIFDYKVKKGTSKSFNATQLMENIGIKIDD